MQKTIEENLSIIKDTTVPLKKKIRKYKEGIELLEKYADIVNKLGNIKRKNRTNIDIDNIDEYMSTSQEILQSFESKEGTVRIVIGTSLMAEGTDLPSADALVLARGGKGDVSLTQASFRVNTAVPGKKYGIIVDFSDRHCASLLKHSVERLKIYYNQPTFSIKVLENLNQLEKEEIL